MGTILIVVLIVGLLAVLKVGLLEGNQQLLVSGSILHVAKVDPATNIAQAARDIGTITVLNPNTSVQDISLFDSRGGTRTQISRRVTQFGEAYEVSFNNMTPENLAYIFGADSVTEYAQTATPITGVSHLVFKDSILHLKDNSGNYIYNVASVQSIGTLVANTDYIADPNLLKMGCVRITTAPVIAAAGAAMNVAFTPTAVSGRRTFNPQTAGTALVEAWVYWTSDGYQTIQVRDHFRATITPAQPEYRDENYSAGRFTLQVINDNTTPSRPAGRWIMPVGSVPNFTF
jgi:hypothetical protein